MYCTKCGRLNDDNAYRCVECGAVLQGARPVAAPVRAPDYLVQAILVTVLCAWPLGIPAIVYAVRANSRAAAGDYAGAFEAARKAKTFCWWSFGVAAGIWGLALVAILVAALASRNTY